MRNKNSSKQNDSNNEVILGILSIVLFIIGIVLASGMYDHFTSTTSSGSLNSPGGNLIFEGSFRIFGILAFLLPPLLIYLSYLTWFAQKIEFKFLKLLGLIIALLSISSASTLLFGGAKTGGVMGEKIVYVLTQTIGRVPAILASFGGIYAALIIFLERKKIINIELGLKEKLISVWNYFTLPNKYKSKEEIDEEIADEFEEDEELEVIEPSNNQMSSVSRSTGEEDVEEEIIKQEVKKPIRIDVEFIPPPLDLLNEDSGRSNGGDTKAKSKAIQDTLRQFGIPVEMSGVTVGPTVTQFRVKPPQGVKVKKILELHQDIQLALSVQSIHIEAPIPGQPYVGIEVPNKDNQKLGLRTMLETPEFQNSSNLNVAIGKNIVGKPVYGDIENMPHLLIAGATKSGKSVTIQNIITSLLYKNSPEDLKLIIVDPKKVEFTLYKGLPHLYHPVITDAKMAIKCLNWAINEMEKRYEYFSNEYAGIQNLADYNKKILIPEIEKAKKRKATDTSDLPERFPYVVIIFDEFNDFMLSYGKEITSAITSLTQKGRAAGIHLILATQRPDVKVITGTIKANIPARIALKTSSGMDSRTILDSNGAEDLLGKGDMLFMDPGEPRPFRVQAPFVSTDEVKAVLGYIKDSYYGYEGDKIDLAKQKSGSISSGEINILADEDEDDEEESELYNKTKEYVIMTGRASATNIQSKFGLGFAKANRMIMKLEERGVIGKLEGNKRKVLIGQNDSTPNTDPLDEML